MKPPTVVAEREPKPPESRGLSLPQGNSFGGSGRVGAFIYETQEQRAEQARKAEIASLEAQLEADAEKLKELKAKQKSEKGEFQEIAQFELDLHTKSMSDKKARLKQLGGK